MEKKDLILNLCEQIKILLYDVKIQEIKKNEPCLLKNYKAIIDLVIQIETERLLYLSFWGDDNE